MFSAVPFAARPVPSLAVAVACLSLAGCGNRGELYLPSEAELEMDGLAVEQPLPDVEAGRRTVTPSDTVNAIAPSGTEDGGDVEREDGRADGERDPDGDAPDGAAGGGR